MGAAGEELIVAWRVGERVVCAGQIDALFADKYGYYYVRVCRGCNRNPCVLYAHAARLWSLLGQMVDFKRTKKSIDANASAFGRTGAGPVSHVPETPFYKYSLQQSMYELMLEHQEDLAQLMTAECGKPLAESVVASELRATACAEGALTVAFTLANEDGDEVKYALALTVPAALDVDACCASALPGCVTLRAPSTRRASSLSSATV